MSTTQPPAAEWNPEIVEFGPYRAIGVRYTGRNENGEIARMWQEELLPRAKEIVRVVSGGSFGVCRCLPGVTDGSFEYIAAFEATPDAPVPAGMVEMMVPQGRYAAFRVKDLSHIPAAWNGAMKWFESNSQWQSYCGAHGCECAERASFEYYPPEFCGDGALYLYTPVRAK